MIVRNVHLAPEADEADGPSLLYDILCTNGQVEAVVPTQERDRLETGVTSREVLDAGGQGILLPA